MSMRPEHWTVAKVGGSLLDLPELDARLIQWYRRQMDPVLFIPGGGRRADRVRRFERHHRLTSTIAHWLAVRAMSRNARDLAILLQPGAALVVDWNACEGAWKRGHVPVLDPYPMLLSDEGNPGCLPHSWVVTSDSIAARVAMLGSADRLVFLKSIALPMGMDWREAGRRGLVDSYFARALDPRLRVDWVNLRVPPAPSSNAATERAPLRERS
jgi:aspartokinase-like uncharacterized kinase